MTFWEALSLVAVAGLIGLAMNAAWSWLFDARDAKELGETMEDGEDEP